MFLLDINLIATEYRQVEFIHNMFDCQLSLNRVACCIDRGCKGCNTHDSGKNSHDTSAYSGFCRDSRSEEPVSGVFVKSYCRYQRCNLRRQRGIEYSCSVFWIDSFIGYGRTAYRKLFCRDSQRALTSIEVERQIGIVINTVVVFQ